MRIGWREIELRRRVDPAGGWSESARRVSCRRRDMANCLDLVHRICIVGVYIWKPGVYM